jgi:tetratricopeptide (TPR) repeat protein
MKDVLSQSSDLYQQARLMMSEDRLDEAVALFQQSVALSLHFKSLELLGECFIRLNRLREAIVPLTVATNLNKGVRAPSLLAEVLLKLEDYQEAKEMADVALSRDSTNRKAREVKKIAAEIVGEA